VAREPVPVFSDPAHPGLLSREGEAALPHDRCGQVRALEFIALAGTIFRVADCGSDGGATICHVTSDTYPDLPGQHLYLDASRLAFNREMPPVRIPVLPARHDLLRRLEGRQGAAYVWGGNLIQGVRCGTGSAFRGVDCSGLLYEATDGFTPRNTSGLVRFGRGVRVAGLPDRELAARLEPLDLLVWDGHVIIVLDGERTIESRLECDDAGRGGVVIRRLGDTVARLLAGRRAVDEWPADGVAGERLFVVRRWYGGNP
jgi:hypothetical protein